jgi:hypothetical protein
MTKGNLIDWLSDNEKLTKQLITQVSSYINKDFDPIFKDDVNTFKNIEVKNLLIDEASKKIGLTYEEWHVIISAEEFDKYIRSVEDNL